MHANDSPSDDSLTFRQQRGKLVLAAFAGLAFVVMGISFVLHPEQWQTHARSAGFIRVIGWITLVFFSMTLVGAAISLIRPTTVRLTPDALVIRTMWRTYSRPWTALSNFRIWKTKGTRLVVFDDENSSVDWLAGINRKFSGATNAMPGFMNTNPEHLLEAVTQAKERWGQLSQGRIE
jgi:hypothetical protein